MFLMNILRNLIQAIACLIHLSLDVSVDSLSHRRDDPLVALLRSSSWIRRTSWRPRWPLTRPRLATLRDRVQCHHPSLDGRCSYSSRLLQISRRPSLSFGMGVGSQASRSTGTPSAKALSILFASPMEAVSRRSVLSSG